jgi:hypothetical protein
MKDYFNNKWNLVIIGAAIVLLLVTIWFVFISDTKVVDKCIYTDKGEFAIVNDKVVPCK